MSEPIDLDAIEAAARAYANPPLGWLTKSDDDEDWHRDVKPEDVLALVAEVRRLRAELATERERVEAAEQRAWCEPLCRSCHEARGEDDGETYAVCCASCGKELL